MVSEQPMLDVLVIWVEVVQNHICVAWVTGCEDDHLEMFAEIFYYLLGVGSDVNTRLYYLASWEGYGQFYVKWRSQGIVTVD